MLSLSLCFLFFVEDTFSVICHEFYFLWNVLVILFFSIALSTDGLWLGSIKALYFPLPMLWAQIWPVWCPGCLHSCRWKMCSTICQKFPSTQCRKVFRSLELTQGINTRLPKSTLHTTQFAISKMVRTISSLKKHKI